MAKTVKEVLEMGKNVKMVDLRFIDVPGTWQHFTIPAHRLNEEFFEEGIPFDGSSIRGFKEIVEGKHDDLPEQAFYLVGTIEEARAKAEKMKQAV